MEFNLVDLKIVVATENPGGVRNSLPALGREFAQACKDVACLRTSGGCRNCQARSDCAWYRLFSQELSSDPVGLKRHQKPPLPFAFSYPLPTVSEMSQRQLEVRLVVVGRAIQHLNVLLAGFSRLLASAALPIIGGIRQVYCCDYQNVLTELSTGGRDEQIAGLVVQSVADLLESRPDNPTRVMVELLSPLKLITDGKQLGRFDFSLFVRVLMRRVSALAYYYADYDFQCDYGELARKAATIVCDENRFSRDVNKKVGGVTGQGTFSGDFSGLMPFLELGTFVNAGKGATYGMGCYTVHAVQRQTG